MIVHCPFDQMVVVFWHITSKIKCECYLEMYTVFKVLIDIMDFSFSKNTNDEGKM